MPFSITERVRRKEPPSALYIMEMLSIYGIEINFYISSYNFPP